MKLLEKNHSQNLEVLEFSTKLLIRAVIMNLSRYITELSAKFLSKNLVKY
jgi:hypothetical protein